jgi:RNA polymerase sigma-70 factor (ECF subfamily)
LPLVEEALRTAPGPFALQAAIAAVHCQAPTAEETDWSEIVGLYNVLQRVQPSPIVSLNRAVAIAMSEGPKAGLALLEPLMADGELENYHLLYAVRADFFRRLDSPTQAAENYKRALALATHDSERRFLERRLREVQPS